MPAFDLQREVHHFAGALSSLLNNTVCNGVRLRAVTDPRRHVVWVGYGIDKRNLSPQGAFPLGIKGESGFYCGLSFQLRADEGEKYLAVARSFMGLFLDAEMERPLMHIDYERDKGDGYPEAHIQIVASSQDWEEALSKSASASDRSRQLSHLHLPVGGRRFRPTLEDLVEFVIAERLVTPRPNWPEVLNGSRDAFALKQLRAAIRRNLNEARKAVEEFTQERQDQEPRRGA